jgi:hypothetical protein
VSVDQDFQSLPLVFLRPVGFAAADAMRLMAAAQDMGDSVRWRLAPIGVQADVYIAHRDRITSKKPSQRHSDFVPTSGSGTFNTYSGTHEHTRLWVDDNSHHKGIPVCVLGQASMHASPNSYLEHPPGLEFPQVLQELRRGLDKAARDLIGLRTLYALGQAAWQERAFWKTHRIHLVSNAQLLAVIEPDHWLIHLLSGTTVQQIVQAGVTTAPQTTAFGAQGFNMLRLEAALWEFAKRCPEDLLATILPKIYLRAALTHRRPSQLSQELLGDYCVAILLALDTRSLTADELQASLRLSRPTLLRALACLALSRCIRPERERRLVWRVTNWLSGGLRNRWFGPSQPF